MITRLLLVPAFLFAADAPDIGRLSFMSGCWEGQAGPVRLEEQWNKPAGGTMLGLSRNLKNGVVLFSEFMRINQEGGKLVYVARIGTKATPTPFEMIRMSGDEVVFENALHDF